MADFQELGTIKAYSMVNGGWMIPTKKLGDGCLCTDGTFSKGKWSADICFATLEDACLAAQNYYLRHNEVYPWTVIGNETIGWICSSFDGKASIKETRGFQSATKTTGQQEGIAAQTTIIQSEKMEF